MSKKIAELQKWVSEAKKLVFFGGAGVSVESGIPDFRSPGGIYDSFREEVRTNGTYSVECVPLVLTLFKKI